MVIGHKEIADIVHLKNVTIFNKAVFYSFSKIKDEDASHTRLLTLSPPLCVFYVL